MPKLIVTFLLALAAVLVPSSAPAVAASPLAPASTTAATFEPPQTYFRGNLGIFTTRAEVRLRIDPGTPNISDPVGEENRSWDVQVLRTDMRSASRPAWQTAITGTTAQRHVLLVGSGRIICVRARQHSWGATSGWSYRTCVVRALDDQAIPRVGPVRVVDDVRYVDGRASKIRARTRMLIAGVPAGALHGPVFTDPPSTVCTRPSWRIRGQREPAGALGVASGALHVRYHRTNVAGTAVMGSPFGSTCPVGGFVVVPRWMPR